ncbi:hypothetical protein [Streptomyces sp. NPDC088137]|uniref:hypothetical protein n=1 Tax=Streptomyces sp. NPDC088137 TaxID=3365827 RepID=UPI0038031700
MHDLEPFRGNETGDRLPTTRVRFEGDNDRQFSTELTSDSRTLLARRAPEHRILKRRRTTDEARIVEDQLQAVVVSEVPPGRQTESAGIPGDDFPVPPVPFRKPDATVPVSPVHPEPLTPFEWIDRLQKESPS